MELSEETIQDIVKFCKDEIPTAIDNPRYRSAVQIFLLAAILEELQKRRERR